MDDRTFDKQTAQDWIEAVEKNGKSFRKSFHVLSEQVLPKLYRERPLRGSLYLWIP